MSIDYYVGLDVSQKQTSICVIDDEGKIFVEGKSLTRPLDIFGWIKNRIEMDKHIKVCLEAGAMSSWLHGGLCGYGLDVVVLETFQAHRFLATYRNKTDKNDARGLSQLLRMGGEDFLRVVKVRSIASQEARTLLALRDHLMSHKISLENHISGVLKPYGLIVARGSVCAQTFYDRVLTALAEAQSAGLNLKDYVLPSLHLYRQASAKIAPLTKQIEDMADNIEMVGRFMDIPGVGPITALAFYTAVDEPRRFKKSTDVAAYFGLTPRQFQSGDMNYMGKISKRGDPLTRRVLVNAATVMLTQTNDWSTLKAWGVRLAKRIGFSKARIAVARKLAIIMHKIWINNDRFRPKSLPRAEREELRRITQTGSAYIAA